MAGPVRLDKPVSGPKKLASCTICKSVTLPNCISCYSPIAGGIKLARNRNVIFYIAEGFEAWVIQDTLPLERVAGIEIQDSQLAYDVLPFC